MLFKEIPVMWMIIRDEMMNRERKQRNRELLLKIRIMKETGFKNPVWHKGGWIKKGMNMINTN